MGLQDASGSWDDAYEGMMIVGIIVVDDDRVDVFDQSDDHHVHHLTF
ncbi:MAG: hypothetical protein HC769_24880 [Cyanobacteria bacterium CRU_2_1]|nr:hypothetical protein [Cyanobacteria bacterium RU_5_0]NJR61778.1 hypothetical protein [Cyanobacteria bacterium CRU_2_1]